MAKSPVTLNNFDLDDFLKNYWQQKPLLIRNAIETFSNPLSPDELAGLACEPEVESRLVIEQKGVWKIQHGPFEEQRFQQLPASKWTLLVQAVDHFIPEVAQLRQYFRFIPNWRIDDVMVSFATTGGSVGPHYDNYDVFLVQGLGQRQWQVGPAYSSLSQRQQGQQLDLLSHFQAKEEWLLEPGDILYLPPQIGHWGIATSDDCMTYSIGFRAPSHAEILSDFCDSRIAELPEELRYNDPGLSPQTNPGEISGQAIEQVQAILQHELANSDQIAQWFGQYMTQPKYCIDNTDNIEPFENREISALILHHGQFFRSPDSRFAFTSCCQQPQLFVDGNAFSCCSHCFDMARVLAAQDSYNSTHFKQYLNHPECVKLLLTLFNQGSLYFDCEVHG